MPALRLAASDAGVRLRSLLFVPGDRPERMHKALGLAADALILDLEDAVAPERKPEARQAVARFLRDGYGNVVDDGSPQQYNRVGDEVSDKDVLAVRGSIAFLIGDSGRFSIMADALRDDSNIRGAQRLNDDFGNR